MKTDDKENSEEIFDEEKKNRWIINNCYNCQIGYPHDTCYLCDNCEM